MRGVEGYTTIREGREHLREGRPRPALAVARRVGAQLRLEDLRHVAKRLARRVGEGYKHMDGGGRRYTHLRHVAK